MNHPRRIAIDFVRPRRGAPWIGAFLCVAGVAAAVGTGVAFDGLLRERDALDARLAGLATPHRKVSATSTKTTEEWAIVERELAVPWAQLLSELESASVDMSSRVALLAVEPDASKRTVTITAETRSLSDALAYLERLQASRVLRYPMLESHERRKDDPEHPIRVKLAAEWRT